MYEFLSLICVFTDLQQARKNEWNKKKKEEEDDDDENRFFGALAR